MPMSDTLLSSIKRQEEDKIASKTAELRQANTELILENTELCSENAQLRNAIERLEQESVVTNNDRQRITDGWQRLSTDYLKLHSEWNVISTMYAIDSFPKSTHLFQSAESSSIKTDVNSTASVRQNGGRETPPLIPPFVPPSHTSSTNIAIQNTEIPKRKRRNRTTITPQTAALENDATMDELHPIDESKPELVDERDMKSKDDRPVSEPNNNDAGVSECNRIVSKDSESIGENKDRNQVSTQLRNNSNCPQCNICGKEYVSNQALKNHSYVHSGRWPYKCDACEKGFATNSDYTRHMKTHTGEKPFQCEFCTFSSAYSYVLIQHRRSHTDDTSPHQYQCSECGRKYKTQHGLQNHIYVHNGRWPYKCETCGKGFGFKADYKRHLLVHTNDRPHECDVCGKTFKLKSGLKVHCRIHTRERPFECCIGCGKRFTTSSHARTHEKICEHK